MNQLLSTVTETLSEATSAARLAELSLKAMLGLVNEALDSSDLARDCTGLRATLHLRPGDGYRGLFARGTGSLTGSPGLDPQYAGVATLWREVSAGHAPMWIDVGLKELTRANGSTVDLMEGEEPELGLATSRSLRQYLAREVHHILILGVPTPGGELAGMAVIEADCPASIGTDFVWPGCIGDLSLFLKLLAPWLVAPAGLVTPADMGFEPEKEDPLADELLPVIGSTTRPLYELLAAFSEQDDETILLSGETGVGKTRLAEWCHSRSSRAGRPFLTPTLLGRSSENQLAELIGWKKGAFTGAVQDNPGTLGAAEGGTVFLDEIDKLTVSAQRTLLRILDERKYQPLGSTETREANVRFIVGTNADLRAAVSDGEFLEDLYYRINVLPIRVPPLSERRDELTDWARHFLHRREKAQSNGHARRVILTDDAASLLMKHPWPGNLRQLDNVIRRAWIMAGLDSSRPDMFVISAEHIQRALQFDQPVSNASILTLMQAASESFVQLAQVQGARGEPLGLEMTDAFRGFVVQAAAEGCGSVSEAYRLFGADSMVESRNHHRDYNKYVEKAEAFSAVCE